MTVNTTQRAPAARARRFTMPVVRELPAPGPAPSAAW